MVAHRSGIWIGGLALVALLAGLIASFYPEHVDPAGVYFLGSLGDAGLVELVLTGNGGRCCFAERSEHYDVIEQPGPSGQMRLAVVGWQTGTNGFFEGAVRGQSAAFVGAWRSADGKTNTPVNLARVAERTVFRRRGGLRLSRYGLTQSFEAETPTFDHPTPFFRAITRQLLEEGRSDGREFTAFSWPDTWQYVTTPSAGNQYEATRQVDIVYLGKEAVSLRELAWEYTGGAHGNSQYNGLNFLAQDDRTIPVGLADLFEPASDWPTRLSDYCVADLKSQGASSITSGSITNLPPEELEQFTLAPAGLTILFSPYAVASYAEGAFAVCVPWSAIQSCLRTNGPSFSFGAPR